MGYYKNEKWKRKKKFKVVKKSVKYDGENLYIKLANPTKETFDKWVGIVKSLSEVEYHINSKYWIAPATKKNMRLLNEKSFHFDDAADDLWDRMNLQRFDTVPLDYSNVEVNESRLRGFRDYQIEGVKHLVANNGCAIIADRMGLGKTAQGIGFINLSRKHLPALVVCPGYLKIKWAREVLRWSGIRAEEIEVLYGQSPYPIPPKKVVLVNYDILMHWHNTLKDYGFETIIGDEIQYISNPESNRSRAFVSLARKIPRKPMLSGTPWMNYPAEFFTALNLIAPDVFPNEYRFKYRYCNPAHNGFDWEFKGATNLKEFRFLIHPYIIRRTKEDLPEKIRILVPLDVQSPEYDKRDKELVKWSKTDRAKKTGDARLNFTELKKLAYEAKKKAAIQWLKDYLATGEKLVLFAYHLNVLDDIEKVFKSVCLRVDGSTSDVKKIEYQDKFNDDPEVKLFLGEIRAANTGLDLIGGRAVAFLEYDWNANIHDQAEGRVQRMIQEAGTIFAYYLSAAGTIDDFLFTLVEKKFKLFAEVMDGESANFIDMETDMIQEIVEIYKQREA